MVVDFSSKRNFFNKNCLKKIFSLNWNGRFCRPFRFTWRSKMIFFLLTVCSALFASPIEERANEAFNEFAEAYARHGHTQYLPDEEITQLGHILEAAHIATMLGAPEEVVVGLLLHDVGRMFAEEDEVEGNAAHYSHDDVGADWAEKWGFPPLTCDCIRNHTLAKVLLCDEDPEYYEALSPISKLSLEVQRKKFSDRRRLGVWKESDTFKAFRLCDDMAKLRALDPLLSPDTTIPSLESYRDMVIRVISGKGGAATNPGWHQKARDWHKMRTKDRASFERFLHN